MNGRSPFDRKPSGASLERERWNPPSSTVNVSRSEEDDARSSSKHRAALEALFAEKSPAAESAEAPTPAPEKAKKVVAVVAREDPRGPEREKRLGKLLAAEGRLSVTKAAEDFVNAGFELPEQQEVALKLLDHDREARVVAALECLARLLDAEPPQRRAVLDARLRRLESDADDVDVRSLAESVRRRLARSASFGR
jgi:hypothetical protein